MGPKRHLASAVAAAGISYLITRNPVFATVCGASCVVPDMDHLFEYLIYKKGKWNREEFWSGNYFEKKGTIYILFHSIELAFLLSVVGIGGFGENQVIFQYIRALAIGYCIHLILDIIANDCTPLGYFAIFRWTQHWKLEKICKSKD